MEPQKPAIDRRTLLQGAAALAGVAAAPPAPWALGPFVREPAPVLLPTEASSFRCPIEKRDVHWERQNVYNPAAVVRAGRVWLLYRADDGPKPSPWGRTCRIGLASSVDGVRFTRHPGPVLYPDADDFRQYEWEGGCEDLHVVEGEDGRYAMHYTTWSGQGDTLSVATSPDLVHWTKHGPAFRRFAPDHVWGSRSGVVVTRIRQGRPVAARIRGRYWMYCTHPCALAHSENLIDWTPTDRAVWPAGGHEAGAIALLDRGAILLMFNAAGWDRPGVPAGTWNVGQAQIDDADLTTILHRQDAPILRPERSWELEGFTPSTTVANALVPFRGRWRLYYGAADHVIGLATCPIRR